MYFQSTVNSQKTSQLMDIYNQLVLVNKTKSGKLTAF